MCKPVAASETTNSKVLADRLSQFSFLSFTKVLIEKDQLIKGVKVLHQNCVLIRVNELETENAKIIP